MAKVDDGSKLTGGDIRRAKGRIYFRRLPGDVVTVSKWPNKRSGLRANSELQQAWIDHFKKGIGMAKFAGGCTRLVAEGLASQPFAPNYFWRDAIMSAFNGKMINYAGDGSGTNYREGPYGPEEVFRVTTPTFALERVTTQNVPTGNGANAAFETVLWDNNQFFNPAQDDRVTIKSKGLYLFSCTVEYTTGAAGFRRTILQNLTQGLFCAIAREQVALNVASEQCCSGLLYCEAGDQIRVLLTVSGGTTVARCRRFQGVGIVPELVTPAS